MARPEAAATETVGAEELRERLVSGEELALLDVREEGVFARGHLLVARSAPLSRLELIVRDLVPRWTAPIVVYDENDGMAERAVKTLRSFGFRSVAMLSGGVTGWRDAGFALFEGTYVPSKAFGEFVETTSHTPAITAEELKRKLDGGEDVVVLDSRPYDEYFRARIPTAVDMPGVELVYRAHDQVPSPDSLVVVNCAGRTRSIIGCQSLRNIGFPNRVVALRNGTMGWRLAGYELERGSGPVAGPPSPAGLARARAGAGSAARRFGVRTLDRAGYKSWLAERERRSLYVLDVRTPEEYEAGHLKGARCAPGGQLVQQVDRYIGTLGARIVLVDDDGVRATITASWLIQMGWQDVSVFVPSRDDFPRETGAYQPEIAGNEGATVPVVEATQLHDLLHEGQTTVIDVSTSRTYRAGHIAGAWFAIRSRLAASMSRIPQKAHIVFTSEDGILAALAARDVSDLLTAQVTVLKGGTAAWRAAGFPLADGFEHMADEPDDVFWRPEERPDRQDDAMREYLSWEAGLVERVDADGTVRFPYPPS